MKQNNVRINFYSDTCAQFLHVKIANTFYVDALIKVRFIQDSGLLRVWIRQVS